ncbi:MAG: alpha/beta fold hydrolase [Gracilimonas sp.]
MNPILFLHGALGTSDQLKPLVEKLNIKQSIHLINFEGHGSGVGSTRPFRMEHFAENVVDYMEGHEIEKADFFGYSMGGYVAMYIARNHPQKAARIASLGTVLKWSSDVSEREVRFLNPEKIREKVPQFAEELDKRHSTGWEEVAAKTKDLLLNLGADPRITDSEWEEIRNKVRIHTGDRDATAGIEQSLDVCKKLENGELMVLPNTPHPIERVDLKLLACSLNDFFS